MREQILVDTRKHVVIISYHIIVRHTYTRAFYSRTKYVLIEKRECGCGDCVSLKNRRVLLLLLRLPCSSVPAGLGCLLVATTGCQARGTTCVMLFGGRAILYVNGPSHNRCCCCTSKSIFGNMICIIVYQVLYSVIRSGAVVSICCVFRSLHLANVYKRRRRHPVLFGGRGSGTCLVQARHGHAGLPSNHWARRGDESFSLLVHVTARHEYARHDNKKQAKQNKTKKRSSSSKKITDDLRDNNRYLGQWNDV